MRVKIKSRQSPIAAGLLVMSLVTFSQASLALDEPCARVAEMAGPAYQTAPLQMGSFTAPDKMPAMFDLTLAERSGAWFIYSSPHSWFAEGCGPVNRNHQTERFEFAPVLQNHKQGQRVVVTPSFMVKTYKAEELETLAQRYDFKLLTRLPSGTAAIFDVGAQRSYDRMLERLERDTTVQYAVPVLPEKRYRLR